MPRDSTLNLTIENATALNGDRMSGMYSRVRLSVDDHQQLKPVHTCVHSGTLRCMSYGAVDRHLSRIKTSLGIWSAVRLANEFHLILNVPRAQEHCSRIYVNAI